MSQVEDLRGFVTQRLTAVSQEILSAVDRVVAGYEAEASGFRQEIERQKNMLNVLLQPRVALNKTGDQQLLTIKVEEHPELITSLDQENPESLHVKEEKPLTTPEFFPTSVHVKNEDEEPQSLQPYRRQTEAEPPSSSSAEQMEADGDDCGGPEPARNSKTVAKVEDSDDDWNNKNEPRFLRTEDVLELLAEDPGAPFSPVDSSSEDEDLVHPDRQDSGDSDYSIPLPESNNDEDHEPASSTDTASGPAAAPQSAAPLTEAGHATSQSSTPAPTPTTSACQVSDPRPQPSLSSDSDSPEERQTKRKRKARRKTPSKRGRGGSATEEMEDEEDRCHDRQESDKRPDPLQLDSQSAPLTEAGSSSHCSAPEPLATSQSSTPAPTIELQRTTSACQVSDPLPQPSSSSNSDLPEERQTKRKRKARHKTPSKRGRGGSATEEMEDEEDRCHDRQESDKRPDPLQLDSQSASLTEAGSSSHCSAPELLLTTQSTPQPGPSIPAPAPTTTQSSTPQTGPSTPAPTTTQSSTPQTGPSTPAPTTTQSSTPQPGPSTPAPAPTTTQSSTQGRGGTATEEMENEEDRWHDRWESDKRPDPLQFMPARTPGLTFDTAASWSPLTLFQLFFTPSVVQTVIDNTNANAAKRLQAGKKFTWKPLTVDDFYIFLAIVIYSGLVTVPHRSDYWRKKWPYNFPFPSDRMTRGRFDAIMWSLHLSDPKEDEENEKKRDTAEYDRLFKIKPLYTEIVNACKAHFQPYQNISFHERMVGPKPRLPMKQYTKDKSTKWGYKVFVLTDASTSYTWNFCVYTGNSVTTDQGLNYNAVMDLLPFSLLGQGYIVYTDSLYTSPTLFQDLEKKHIGCCGTIRRNHVGFPQTLANDLPKKAQRGDLRWIRDNKLLFVKWMDTREVTMCSTVHEAFSGQMMRRKEKQAGVLKTKYIPIPDAVMDYNRHMGYVDLSDATSGCYSAHQKTMKWYKSFFYHFVDVAVANGFLLQKELFKKGNDPTQTKLHNQKIFREQLAAEMLEFAQPSQPAPPPPTTCMPTFFEGEGSRIRKFCKRCQDANLPRIKTAVYCKKCQVPLCLTSKKNCFLLWHNGQ